MQGLSEVFERYVKNRIIAEAISLPEIPKSVMDRYPSIQASITKLEEEGFPNLCFRCLIRWQISCHLCCVA